MIRYVYTNTCRFPNKFAMVHVCVCVGRCIDVLFVCLPSWRYVFALGNRIPENIHACTSRYILIYQRCIKQTYHALC